MAAFYRAPFTQQQVQCMHSAADTVARRRSRNHREEGGPALGHRPLGPNIPHFLGVNSSPRTWLRSRASSRLRGADRRSTLPWLRFADHRQPFPIAAARSKVAVAVRPLASLRTSCLKVAGTERHFTTASSLADELIDRTKGGRRLIRCQKMLAAFRAIDSKWSRDLNGAFFPPLRTATTPLFKSA